MDTFLLHKISKWIEIKNILSVNLSIWYSDKSVLFRRRLASHEHWFWTLEIAFFGDFSSNWVTRAQSFWAAKSDFCSIMQKLLHDKKNFLQPKNFCHLCQNSFFHTTFDIQSFWKVHEISFKNFYMVRENFCMLRKSAPLILQPRKTLLLSTPKFPK